MKRILVFLGVTIIATGCSRPLTPAEKGALIGGAVGVLAGAAIADASRHPTPPPPQVVAAAPAQVVVAAPPRVVVPTAPHMVWIPEWGVYVMEGHDIVYHQTSYYQYANGYWWISPSYAGPWALVATPPPTIANLPPGRLHHHPVRRAYVAAQASPPTAPIIVQAPPAVIVAAPPQAAPVVTAPGQIFPAPRPHAPHSAVVVAPPVVAAAPAQPTPPSVVQGAVTPAPPVAAAPVVVAPPVVTAPASVAPPATASPAAPPPAVVAQAPTQLQRGPGSRQEVAAATPPPAGAPGRPNMIWVAEWGVHLMEGQDIVYYNEAYFSFSGGQWSISHSYAGPWTVVPTPPAVIASLPPGQLHSHLPPSAHHGRCPPGLAKQGRC